MDTSYLSVLESGINNFLGSTGEWSSTIAKPVSDNIFNNILDKISKLYEIISGADTVLGLIPSYIDVWNEIEKYDAEISRLSSLYSESEEESRDINAQISMCRLKRDGAKRKLQKLLLQINGAYNEAMGIELPDVETIHPGGSIVITVDYVELSQSIAKLASLIGSGSVDTSELNQDFSKYGLPSLSALKAKIDAGITETEAQLNEISNNVSQYASNISSNEGAGELDVVPLIDYDTSEESTGDFVTEETISTEERQEAPVAQDDSEKNNNENDKDGIYVVQPGDSLSKIASKIYGDDSRYQEIYEINKDVIGNDPNMIGVGMVLTLPGAGKAVVESNEHVENLEEGEVNSGNSNSSSHDTSVKTTGYKITSYHPGDDYGSGTKTGSGFSIDDFDTMKIGDKTVYTYEGKIVVAAATEELLNTKYDVRGAKESQPDKYYFRYGETLQIKFDGNTYDAIVLDSCGASMWNGQYRIDIFVPSEQDIINNSDAEIILE